MKFVRQAVSGLLVLWRRPWPMAATVAAVAVTVFFGGLFALAAQSVDAVFAQTRGQVRFQVYWKPDASPDLVARQWTWMRELPGVVEARSFTPQAALAIMGQTLGRDADLSALGGHNPLPYTMLLALRPPEGEADFARAMYARLSAVEGVAEVRYNPLEVDLTLALGTIGSRIALPLAAMLTLLIGLVVGNTVRLSLLQRREEMEILRLVGATEWYIRRPMIWGAALTGAIGATLAMVLLKIVQASLAELLGVPPLSVPLPFLSAGTVAVFVCGTALVSALAGLAAAMETQS